MPICHARLAASRARRCRAHSKRAERTHRCHIGSSTSLFGKLFTPRSDKSNPNPRSKMCPNAPRRAILSLDYPKRSQTPHHAGREVLRTAGFCCRRPTCLSQNVRKCREMSRSRCEITKRTQRNIPAHRRRPSDSRSGGLRRRGGRCGTGLGEG